MQKPLIAVTSDMKWLAPYNRHTVPEQYINAAYKVTDCVPVLIPAIGSALEIDTLLDRIDGLLVTGALSNVHPSTYGVAVTEGHEPFDEARDNTTLPLIRRAIERGIPLLAICRGIQELNVAFGGSITAEFRKIRSVNHHDYDPNGTSDERFALSHDVKITENSSLAEILKDEIQNGTVKVNSLHTQAIDQLGENVIVEAICDDGTIEAVTVQGASGFVVAVQWHPEYWATTDAPSKKIFEAFGNASRACLAAKSATLIAAE